VYKIEPIATFLDHQCVNVQKALRIKRDGYVNKYTNPRKAETTTPEYITVIQDLKIQDLKQQAKNSLRSDYKTNSTKALTTESTTISNTKCTICNHQLNTAVGLKIHVTKMHKNIKKTKN
jgi:hypothetical protein